MEPQKPITTEDLDKAMQEKPRSNTYAVQALSVSAMAMASMGMGRAFADQNYVGTPCRKSKRHTQKPGYKRKKKGKSR